MRGAHRVGTPVWQLLSELQAERNAQLPAGIELPGPISDRLRAMDPAAGVEIAPERGTEADPGLPPSAYTGISITGRAGDPRKDNDDHALES